MRPINCGTGFCSCIECLYPDENEMKQSVKSVVPEGTRVSKLHIDVSGTTGSGKSLIQQLIAKVLRDHGVSYTIDWGPDGNLCRTDEQVADFVKRAAFDIEISSTTLRRDGTKPD